MSRKRFDREERLQGEVVDLSSDGRGVVRHPDGKTVFVADALRGEVVEYRRRKRNRSFDEAELLEVLQASPERVEPGCSHFGQCGGCSLQHLEPKAQLAAKQNTLEQALQRIGGGLSPVTWLAPLTGPVWGYRRRARLACKQVAGKGRVLVGFRERNGRYVADIQSCPVLDQRMGELLIPLSDLLGGLSIPDQIPQIEASAGDNQVLLLLRHLQPLSAEDREKLRAFAEQHAVHWYLQSGGPDTIVPLGEPCTLRYALDDYAADLEFGPGDFIQVNTALNRKMIPHALSLLNVSPGARVLELFSGLGNFTIPLLRSGYAVTAVEGAQTLVDKGRANLARHDLQADYHVADLFACTGEESWLQESYDAVLLDPPRSGAADIIPHILRRPPQNIVYVSCHPGSLARDAGSLVAGGYRLEAAGVMDMFPHTGHVESIASFHWDP
nr:23S rRNA (uracil(1939)-C(5))-methyltransferase RlmD [Oceanococcus sp. HetDA_MAG_MS8]